MTIGRLGNQTNFAKARSQRDLPTYATLSLVVVPCLILTGCSTARRDPDAPRNSKAPVVYATKDIPENVEIKADALEQRDLEQRKIPENAIYKPDEAVGKISKYGIAEGQIISTFDLEKMGGSDTIVISLKDGYGKKMRSIADKKKKSMTQLAADWLNERIEKESCK